MEFVHDIRIKSLFAFPSLYKTNNEIGDEHNGIYKTYSDFFKQFFHNECIGYVSTFFDGTGGGQEYLPRPSSLNYAGTMRRITGS